MNELIGLLQHSDLAVEIREDEILFPLIESVHVLFIALVVGSIMIMDLRLLGVASMRRSVTDVAAAVLPVTWICFGISAIAGFLMFISNANQYLGNGFFVTKMLLMALAGANMILFHKIFARDMTHWSALPPRAARLSGGVSLALWIAIVACGRWIGFTMPVS
jgi:hypothetical protein